MTIDKRQLLQQIRRVGADIARHGLGTRDEKVTQWGQAIYTLSSQLLTEEERSTVMSDAEFVRIYGADSP